MIMKIIIDCANSDYRDEGNEGGDDVKTKK